MMPLSDRHSLMECFLSLTVMVQCATFINQARGQTLTKLGTFKVSNPAFATLYENPNATEATDKFDLLISTFSAIPFSTDTVQFVKGVGNYMKNVDSIKTTELTSDTTWPNEVAGVPEKVFGKRMVVIPDGFILPFKTEGRIRLMDISRDPAVGPDVITDDSTGTWFYHRVRWHDMDGDGDFDVVTCRAREPIIGTKASEILWLENPNGDVTVPWQPHVLGHGPDIFFEYIRLNSTAGPFDCIVTSQFFSQSLSLYWTTDPAGHWTDLSKIQSRVIDASIGAVFDVGLYDVNADGKPELLVNNNGNNGSLFVYELPDDFRTGNFMRHTVATGFRPLHVGKGKGAPGAAFPVITSSGKKPVILLSGDDDGHAYLLTPRSQDASDWQYSIDTILTTGSDTVGQIAHADVDGDGLVEVFVPSYSTSEVFVYRLS